jgi:hypothetical protein
MKQENLKNHFTFKAINLLLFGNFFNKFFIGDFFPNNKEFVTKYSFFKRFFAKDLPNDLWPTNEELPCGCG